MLPGKAKSVPVPSMFRMTLATKAAAAAHHGPRRTPATALTACWKGKHFVGPTGMESPERSTATAHRRPAVVTVLILKYRTDCCRRDPSSAGPFPGEGEKGESFMCLPFAGMTRIRFKGSGF
jgi:hypothetical protein